MTTSAGSSTFRHHLIILESSNSSFTTWKVWGLSSNSTKVPKLDVCDWWRCSNLYFTDTYIYIYKSHRRCCVFTRYYPYCVHQKERSISNFFFYILVSDVLNALFPHKIWIYSHSNRDIFLFTFTTLLRLYIWTLLRPLYIFFKGCHFAASVGE